MSIQFVTLDLKRLNINAAQAALKQKFIIAKIEGGDLKVATVQSDKAQAIIDTLANQMPDLLPVQFHFMLNKYGFDDVIASLLPALKTEDLEKYAMYIEQARYYGIKNKTSVMFEEIRDKFSEFNKDLNSTQLNNLKICG